MNIKSEIDTLEKTLENLDSEEVDLNTAIDDYAGALKKAKTLLTHLNESKGKLSQLEKTAEGLIETPIDYD